MVIKGSCRGQSSQDARRLARHLMNCESNETVELIELKGCAATDLPGAIAEMRVLAQGSRTVRSLYSASINVAPDEQHRMTTARWREAVRALEERLGMQGHQRAIVRHRKKGSDGRSREHIHVVWNQVNPATLKAARDSWTYRAHEETARALEERSGLRPTRGVHTRPPGTPRPVARASHRDQQAAIRTGIGVDEVSANLRDAWRRQSSGSDFARIIQAQGLTLARGRRGIVAVDAQGVPHSLPRRLGLRAAEVRAGLQNIDIDRLPTVADGKRRGVAAPSKEESMGNKLKGINGVACAKDTSGRQRPSWPELQDYWTRQGYTSDIRDKGVWVNLNGSGWLHDAGDRITVYRDGDPTDDDIRLLVQAGRERGWQTIRFFGGSDGWQRRAREEAIRQGFRRMRSAWSARTPRPRPWQAPFNHRHASSRHLPTNQCRST